MSGYNAYRASYAGDGSQIMDPADSSGFTMMGGDMAGTGGGSGGQSLDDIVNQNEKMIRRQSMPQQQYGRQSHGQMEPGVRRISSMMEFSGGSPAGPLENFNFDPSGNMNGNDMSHMSMPMQQSGRQTSGHQQSNQMNNQYSGSMTPQYGSLMSSAATYQSPAHANNPLDMDLNSPYAGGHMGMSMDFANDPSMNNVMASDQHQMSMFNQTSPYHSTMMTSPMPQSAMQRPGPSTGQNGGSGAGSSNGGSVSYDGRLSAHGGSQQLSKRQSSDTLRQPSRSQSYTAPDQGLQQNTSHRSQQQSKQTPMQSAINEGNRRAGQSQEQSNQGQMPQSESGRDNPKPLNGYDPSNYNPNNQGFNWETRDGGWPSTMVGKPHMQSGYKNAYSSTGFDMLGVLMRVATRPNPEINLGSVDLSCAFVVCDAEKDDLPIAYCSDNFERLTGYTRHMVLGRNCRFLQSPDGNVEPGVRRKYVDDDSVLYLKNMVNLQREAQISLINYRRGGQPFMNLLTMIPIRWDNDQVKFFVGFQVDLVEQPNAVTSRNPDGSYAVNYQRGMTMPRYVMNAPESTHKPDMGQTIPRDDVSAILGSIGTGESDYAKRMWDRVLLENTDDVVHVLSLKGLFQWVSPSALKVLEYEPGEIIGTALSSVCHPSDIVPVTRDLKDTSTGASVNVVFRIRRKKSGYMWFEGHGSLHTEQGKGRKSIIMVGRERPVYTISKSDIVANGGIGENELWTKMSTSGMFLFVSSNVRQLLDRTPEEMIGVSIQSLMRSDSKADFGRILEHARTGKKASVKHEVINRRGQVLQAFTTLYPGDASEGQKPTFIVAQTRLIKYARNNVPNRPSVFPKTERNSSESVHSVQQGSGQTLVPHQTPGHGGTTPQSSVSGQMYMSTDNSAATYAGQNGLRIGNQDASLASEDNLFDELKTTKSSSWQYEIRQLEKRNRLLAEEVQSLLAAKKKRKRRKGAGQLQKDCANCHTRVTPEWRRGPSGQRDLCNSCGLRWAKLNGRVSPRTSSQQSVHSAASDKASKASASPRNSMIRSDTGGGGIQQTSSNQATPGHDSGINSMMQTSPQIHSSQMEGAAGIPEKIEEGIEPD